jgi:hypothetical protein
MHMYITQTRGRMSLVHQFEGKVVLDSELDSKWDSWIPNWLRLPPCCACFFVSSEPTWCPTCSPWSTPWFLITNKLSDSNLFSRSLVDEHKNKFTWRHSCCACDLIIGPYNSIEGMVVSDIVMSSSQGPLISLATSARLVWLGNQECEPTRPWVWESVWPLISDGMIPRG